MIRLLDAAGEVVDALTYDDAAPWPVEADGNGATLALRNPLLDNTAAASWGASASGGTPGERNDTYEELTGGCAALWRPFLRGDSNADGQVDLSDAIGTLRFLFQEEEVVPCLDAADANDDGTVDLSDSLATIFHLFLGTVELPAPGTQACGVDPTADALSCASHPPCAE